MTCTLLGAAITATLALATIQSAHANEAKVPADPDDGAVAIAELVQRSFALGFRPNAIPTQYYVDKLFPNAKCKRFEAKSLESLRSGVDLCDGALGQGHRFRSTFALAMSVDSKPDEDAFWFSLNGYAVGVDVVGRSRISLDALYVRLPKSDQVFTDHGRLAYRTRCGSIERIRQKGVSLTLDIRSGMHGGGCTGLLESVTIDFRAAAPDSPQ